jgi:hypothetical protein
MTRDEHRAKCAKAIMEAMSWEDSPGKWLAAFAIIDSLYGIARVVPLKGPEGMAACDAVNEVYDLTNAPEQKP